MGKIKITGVIVNTLFRDENSGYSILLTRTTHDDLKKIRGCFSAYPANTPFRAEIQPVEGKDVYDTESFSETTVGVDDKNIRVFLTNLESENIHLSSGAIAKMLNTVSAGKDLFETELKFNNPTDQRIVDKTMILPRLQRLFREMVQSLAPAGERINLYQCNRYIEKNFYYAFEAFEKYTSQVCVKSLGMSFKLADAISVNLHHDKGLDDRLAALGIDIMEKLEKSGSTCLTFQELIARIQETMYSKGLSISAQKVEKALMYNDHISLREDIASFGTTIQSEDIIAGRIRELLENKKELFSLDELMSLITQIETENNIKYADAQKSAFKLLRTTGLAVLTGGPGTGKTTVLKGLLSAYMKKYPLNDVVMASPTGRAAQRMTESTGHEAMTIHRLVGIGRSRRGTNFVRGDIVIIDEASMIDTDMCAWLLTAISPKSLVLFVGDIDQLPSVGAGNVLKDLIESRMVPVCRLQTVFRQTGESAIITNANKINRGEFDLVTDDTFVLHEQPNDKEIITDMVNVVKKALQETNDPVYGVQVLSTSHRSEAGISEANKILQQMLNPAARGKKGIRFGSIEFREGDKVLTTQNNYEEGYFNGDIGVIKSINNENVEIQLSDRIVKVKRQHLGDLSLGYCISIHKSQGSEFDHAIILLPGNPAIMLKRNLLYTAITRSKKNCTVIYAPDAVKKCALSIDNTIRSTYLPKLLGPQP